MHIKVSDYIAKFLFAQNITHVFEVAGGMITHLLDSIHQLNETHIISVHHEQAAAFSADAYGRMTGLPGWALATSGPGATNLLTGIANCYFDSSPAIFITGQVNTNEQKGTLKIRQLGFQETDIVSMAMPITKKTFRVQEANQVEAIFNQAYECAISDRPGPVLIDLPMNIQREKITVSSISKHEKKSIQSESLTLQCAVVNEYILEAKRPLILLGGGVHCARAKQECLQFINQVKIPVVTSLLALDLIPFKHPLRVGFIGTYGNRWANIALSEADLLIVIGSRLDVRQTGADVEGFSKNKTIIHIDCDESEINNRVKNCISLVTDAKLFFVEAIRTFNKQTYDFTLWMHAISKLKKKWPDVDELKKIKGINPNVFMHLLSIGSHQSMGYVVDVGSHQMWAAQSLEISAEQCFLTSGGMGAMGFALPAAIGASLSNNKRPILVIVGDGAFQMNIQELQTVVRNRIPLKIVIINNKCLGMIRQFQDSYFEGRHQSTTWGYSAPDFAAISEAYGIAAKTVAESSELKESIQWLWSEPNEPALLQVMIQSDTNVYPKIAFGRPICEMEPFALPISIEST